MNKLDRGLFDPICLKW